MGGWGDGLLAGVAGGAGELGKAQQFYAGEDTKKTIEQHHDDVLKSIAVINANQRGLTADELDKRTRDLAALQIQAKKDLADQMAAHQAELERLKGTNRLDYLTKDWGFRGGENALDRDMKSSQFTSGLDELRRFHDQTDSRGRYGIDTGAATSRGNAALASRTAQRGQNIGSQNSRAAARARGVGGAAGLFGDTSSVDFLASPLPGTEDTAPVEPQPLPSVPVGPRATSPSPKLPVPVAPRGKLMTPAPAPAPPSLLDELRASGPPAGARAPSGAPARPPAAIGGAPPPAAAAPASPAGNSGSAGTLRLKMEDGRIFTFPNDAAMQQFLQLTGSVIGNKQGDAEP